MADTGRYVYAVLDAPAAAVSSGLEGIEGIDGAAVEAVEHRGLVALASDVDLGEYGEDGLRRNLEDLAWLESTARAHDEVVRAAFAVGPTAPLRLATIFRDDAAVRARLEEWSTGLRRALDRVTGRVEWSVKLLASSPEPTPTGGSGTAGGAAYLRRKKAESQARRVAEAAALEGAERIAEALGSGLDGVVAVRRLQPQDPRLSGLEGTMLLNLAVLVDRDASDGLGARVQDLADAEPAVAVSAAGPWPPYSFATLEPQ